MFLSGGKPAIFAIDSLKQLAIRTSCSAGTSIGEIRCYAPTHPYMGENKRGG